MAPLGVHLDRVSKSFGAVKAVDGVSLSVEPGSFVSLLGPSGSGKSTLLRLVGGFEQPDAGTIRMGSDDVTTWTPQRRPTATVFQSYALFPSMTVGENVGYGLSVQGVSARERAPRVTEALGRVELAGLEDRPVSALSGGQQQRVALARALAVEPRVILFDEPLSNLDLALREATRAEIRALHDALGTTSLYVTHDQQEALALSDQIAVLRDGRLVALAPPETLYADPPTAYVATFLGGANLFEGAAAERLAGEPAPAGHVLAVRPEHIELGGSGDAGSIPARLVARQFLGLATEWLLDTDGGRVRLWGAPDLALPDPLAIVATRSRWVPDDRESAPS